MAQVTMSNQEYMALQRKADNYDRLFQAVLDNIEVELTDSSWSPVRLNFNHNWPADMEEAIVRCVAMRAVEVEGCVATMKRSYLQTFDIENFSFHEQYGETRLYKRQYDLCDNSEFKYAWDNVKDEDENKEEAE